MTSRFKISKLKMLKIIIKMNNKIQKKPKITRQMTNKLILNNLANKQNQNPVKNLNKNHSLKKILIKKLMKHNAIQSHNQKLKPIVNNQANQK